jgi:hypothetical protein
VTVLVCTCEVCQERNRERYVETVRHGFTTELGAPRPSLLRRLLDRLRPAPVPTLEHPRFELRGRWVHDRVEDVSYPFPTPAHAERAVASLSSFPIVSPIRKDPA